jgi:hypothetical protein
MKVKDANGAAAPMKCAPIRLEFLLFVIVIVCPFWTNDVAALVTCSEDAVASLVSLGCLVITTRLMHRSEKASIILSRLNLDYFIIFIFSKFR